jgi:hypothetical protein
MVTPAGIDPPEMASVPAVSPMGAFWFEHE